MKKSLLSYFFIYLALTCTCFSATYYISPTGNDTTGNGTNTNPWATFSKGISMMSGGDTLIAKDGTYTGNTNRINNPPSGTPGAYTSIVAEHDWGVSITGVTSSYPCNIGAGYNYIRIQGFKFLNNSTGNNCLASGDYVKVIRCGADGIGGGPGSSFCADGNFILFEECYSWGAGRYPMRTAQQSAQYVVFRRCVVRWDYSNTSGPQACFANYDCPNVYFQNCIAIDGKDIRAQDITYDGLKGYFTPNGAKETHFTGCISLNIEGGGYWIEDAPVSSVTIRNCVAWDSKNTRYPLEYSDGYQAYLLYTRPIGSGGGPLSVDHCTLGICDLGSGMRVQYLIPDSPEVKNSIIYGLTLNSGNYSLDISGSHDYNCFYNNTGNRDVSSPNSHEYCAANGNAVNPLTNSLLYLPRIESGSALSGLADDGGSIGANITKKIGVSGTLYGEAGWNTVTDENLWPFPNEAEMKADMKAFSKAPDEAYAGSPAMSGNRGFCANGKQLNGVDDITLTSYIWEYLGNPIPQSIYGILPVTAPSNLSAIALSTGSISLTWTDNSNNETGFKIERKTGITGTYAQIVSVSMNTASYSDGGLQPATTYYYRVRAYNSTADSNYTTEACAVTNALIPDYGGTDNKNSNDTVVMKAINEGEAKVLGSKELRGAINPDKGDTARIYFKGKETGRYECRIYTLNGDLLWETTKDNVSEGLFEWIPGDIASGGYIAQVKGPGLNIKKKIVVVR